MSKDIIRNFIKRTDREPLEECAMRFDERYCLKCHYYKECRILYGDMEK